MIAAIIISASQRTSKPRLLLLNMAFSILVSHAAAAEVNSSSAEAMVKAAPCIDNQNIEAVLEKKISSSQRDLGWQVFEDGGSFIVEKAVLISKSMQLRYRWQVDNQGNIQPVSDRAQELCISQ